MEGHVVRGSSPHTRGALLGWALCRGLRRIIPAYAGSTFWVACGYPKLWDHPRIRGEHYYTPLNVWMKQGSSSHTRGARTCRKRPISSKGIIPAYAGSTYRAMIASAAGWGSSPHTRGAPLAQNLRNAYKRIIPAYAGSTDADSPKFPAPADHPRIRGEHAWPDLASAVSVGSSPHTRGARWSRGGVRMPLRIIPAYAGSTNGPHTTSSPAWDHPRIRGEHAAPSESDKWDEGSSPHTRGAQVGVDLLEVLPRIIPAYAGSTLPPSVYRIAPADHPRIRGEHVGPVLGQGMGLGSSPHTRGARVHQTTMTTRRGIIPAYAGSTRGVKQYASKKADHPRIRGEHSMPLPYSMRPRGSSPHTRGAPWSPPV